MASSSSPMTPTVSSTPIDDEVDEEEYERMRAEDIEIIMKIVNAIPKVPRKTEDLEPYRALDKIHRDWREGLSSDDSKLPMEQLPVYLKVPPTDGAFHIPNYKRPKLHFGIALTAEEIMFCALRFDLPIKPLHGKTKNQRSDSCVASVRRAGYEIAEQLSELCNHRVVMRYAAGLDGLFVFAIYNNFNHGDRQVEERDEKVILDVIGKVLGTKKTAKWYFEGYSE